MNIPLYLSGAFRVRVALIASLGFGVLHASAQTITFERPQQPTFTTYNVSGNLANIENTFKQRGEAAKVDWDFAVSIVITGNSTEECCDEQGQQNGKTKIVVKAEHIEVAIVATVFKK